MQAAKQIDMTGWRALGLWLSARFELSRDGGEGNIRAMEGLRGLAVFLVFLVHGFWFIGPWTNPTGLLGAVGFVHGPMNQNP